MPEIWSNYIRCSFDEQNKKSMATFCVVRQVSDFTIIMHYCRVLMREGKDEG